MTMAAQPAKPGRRRGRALPSLYDRQAPSPFNGVVATLETDDPYSPSDRNDRITVTRSIRDDPLGRLHARGQVDEAQYLAGRRWQALYEAVEIGGARGIDPTREAVDGGRGASDGLTDARKKAARDLARADTALGSKGMNLIRSFLGSGLTPTQLASMMVDTGQQRDRDRVAYVVGRIVECLQTLSVTI